MIIGIYTKNFALLSKITAIIKDKSIKLVHLKNLPIDNKTIQVLISEKRIKNCKIPQIQPDNLDILELKIRCTVYKCSEVVIGIDPGGMNGLSVIGANRILFIDTYKDMKKLANTINSVKLEIGIRSIKIGLGSPPERNRILEFLKPHSGIIELVDEQNSGSGSHTDAATRIALRKGELSLNQSYAPKDGEIAWIQKKSRRASKGLVTVDKDLAHDILVGTKNMNEAINICLDRIRK